MAFLITPRSPTHGLELNPLLRQQLDRALGGVSEIAEGLSASGRAQLSALLEEISQTYDQQQFSSPSRAPVSALQLDASSWHAIRATPGEPDVTKARAEVEQVVRSLKEQWAALEHHATITVTDTTGRITYANDRFCEMTGYSRDELIGQTHRLVNSGFHPPEFFAVMWQAISCGQVWRGELCNRTKAGQPLWLAATIVPMLDAAGVPREYIAFRTDITAQKHAEAELRRAKEAADLANQSKSTFLATMSHEIRTPMNAIIGMTSLALDLAPQGELRENLDIVLDSARALLGTLNDVLDFSKIEAGRLTVEAQPFELPELLERSLRTFTHLATSRGLTLSWQLDDALEGFVVGDPHRLRQIINNLIGNALKFTTQGGVTVFARREGDEVRLEVRDTGIGIEPHQLERVFEPFEQADTSTTRRFGGTGLGLAITRSLARLMGGTVTLASTPQVGTTANVQLRLPKCEAPHAPAAQLDAPASRALRVLVAEDNKVNQLLLQRLLERWGHQVVLVGDGLAAVACVEAGQIDVVLMDVNMPTLGGLEATRRIRAGASPSAQVPIIAMTANATEGDRQHCLDLGMNDYVAKPLDPVLLRRALAHWCASPSVQAAGAAPVTVR